MGARGIAGVFAAVACLGGCDGGPPAPAVPAPVTAPAAAPLPLVSLAATSAPAAGRAASDALGGDTVPPEDRDEPHEPDGFPPTLDDEGEPDEVN